MASRPTIFLSYTRRDHSGIEAADALERKLTAEGFDVWRDKSRLDAGYNWAPEIEREVERRDVLIAMISPSYRDSEICRAEHVLALRKGRRVLPVMVEHNAPLPLHLVNKQYLNFSEFAGLLRALGSDDTAALKPEYQKRRSNITSDRRPERFVPRPEELDALKRLILSEDSPRSTSIIGVRGQGGIGKTVLAAELARDRAIEAAFPDGIVWLPIGREPRELPTFLKEAARILGGCSGDNPGDYSTDLAAYNSFRECVRDKAALLVLDDIWESRHVRPFLPLEDADAPRLRLVCTTRKPSVTSSLRAREYPLGTLPPPLAGQLLAEWLNCTAAALPPRAQIILDHCHGHALALKQIGSLLAQKIRNWGQEEGWDYVLQWLKRLPFDPELKSVMETSLAALPDETARERYLDLAVFPDETPIPFSVLHIYWQTTKFDAQDTVDAWLDLSLVEKSKDNRLILHDLQLDYVKARRESPALHGNLVDAATDDDYFLAWLPYHLKHAGRETELEALLMNPDWLRKKLKQMGTAAVRADFGYASSEACSLLARTLDLSSHVLSRDPDQLAFQLFGRLLDQPNPQIRELLHVLESELALRPLHRCLDAPGAIIRRLEGHSDGVLSVAVTPDGARAVSGSSDHTLIVWDLATGAIERRLEGHSGSVTSVVVTTDGTRAVSGSADGTLIVWDLTTGAIERRLEGHSGGINSVAVTTDGSRAISASSDSTLIVWDLSSGANEFRLERHSTEVKWVALTSDGAFAMSTSLGKLLIVWNLRSHCFERYVDGHLDVFSAYALLPNGAVIFESHDYCLAILNLKGGYFGRHLEGHSRPITSVAVTPDGAKAVSVSYDNTLIAWDLNTGGIERRLDGHSGIIRSVAVTPDGARAVTGSDDNTLIVWDLAAGVIERPLEHHSDRVWSVAVTSDGSRAVSGSSDGTVMVWNLVNGAIERRLECHSGVIRSVAVTPDGARAITESDDNTLIVWNLATGKTERHLEGHEGWVRSIAVTPDGLHAVSGSSDGIVIVWNLATGMTERRLELHSGRSWLEAVTPDGSHAISECDDHTLIVWDLATGAIKGRLGGHPSWVGSVMLTPDGARAVSASKNTLIVWDLTTGVIERYLEGHSGWIRSVVVTADGTRAISGSEDNTLKIWCLADGRCLGTVTLDAQVGAMARHGERVIAGDARGTVHCFELAK